MASAAALAVLAAAPSGAGARPAVVADTSGARGFTPYSGSTLYSQRSSYTIRLTASYDGSNVELLRSHFQAAAAQITSNGGPQLTVAPGIASVGSSGVADGEIWVYAGDQTCLGLADAAGCAGPDTRPAVPVSPALLANGTQIINTGSVYIKAFALNYSSANLSNLVAHELGHVFGLNHFNNDYLGQRQAMYLQVGPIPAYRTGDLNGLRYMYDADQDGARNEIDQCPLIAGAIGNSGCPLGNASVLTSGGMVATAFADRDYNLRVYSRTFGGPTSVGGAMWGAAANSIPSSVISADGQIQTAFVDYDKKLRLYQWTPGGAGSVSPVIAGVAPNSSPSSIITYDGQVQTAFISDTGFLRLYRWTPGGSATLTNNLILAAAGTSPSIVVNASGQIEIAFIALDNKLHFYRIAEGAATGSNSVGVASVAPNTSPHAVITKDRSVQTAYVANDLTLRMRTRTLANIQAPSSDTQYNGTSGGGIYGVSPGTSPQSVVTSNGEVETAFHASNEGAMKIYRWTPGGAAYVTPAIFGFAAGTSPGSLVNSQGEIETMFVGSEGSLRTYKWTQSGSFAAVGGEIWGAFAI